MSDLRWDPEVGQVQLSCEPLVAMGMRYLLEILHSRVRTCAGNISKISARPSEEQSSSVKHDALGTHRNEIGGRQHRTFPIRSRGTNGREHFLVIFNSPCSVRIAANQ